MASLSQIGRYRIEARLGSGTLTDVYRAADTVLKRSVALKVFKPGLLTSQQAYLQFLRQAQLASDLVHPHIAWIWDSGEAEGFYYLAERFVNGPPLDKILSASGPFPWEQSRQIIREIAQALDFAHGRGWVHGDIRPQNVLLSPDLGAVLTDFGLRKAIQASHLEVGDLFYGRAPLYTPPEVWTGKPAGPASDQYALACTLVELLTGQALFQAPTPHDTRARHLAPLELPQPWPASVPRQIDTVLRRALAHNPGGRYPNAGAFAEALDSMAAVAPLSAEESAQLEAQSQARREEDERARQAAEEVVRLAALEQARREIDEQLQRAAQTQAVLETEESAETSIADQLPAQPSIPRARPKPWYRRWSVWLGIGLISILLAGLWLNRSSSTGFLALPETITPTAAILSPATFPPPSRTATQTATATLIITVTATATPVYTPTQTLTFTPTFTPSNTPAPTLSLTPTRTPHVREPREPKPTKPPKPVPTAGGAP